MKDRMKIICVHDNDDPIDAIIAIKRHEADGVLASPHMMATIETHRNWVTGKPISNTLFKGSMAEATRLIALGHKLVYIAPSLVIEAERSRNISTSTVDCKTFENKFANPIKVAVRVMLTDFLSQIHGPLKSFTIVKGGVTGHESVWITKDFIYRTSRDGWLACAGGSGWDKLFIPAAEMARAHEELKSNVYQSQID